MKDERLFIRIMWTIAVIPLLVTLAVFTRLPDLIPMHWNISGQIDAYYPKFPGAFLLPALGLVIVALMNILPNVDPKKENYVKFRSQYLFIRLFLVAFFAVIQFVVIAISLGADFIRVDLIVKLLVGIMFIVIGNLMPKLKHNYFVGIKTPWTLANESVWLRSHRHGGFVWFATGIVLVCWRSYRAP